MATVLDVLQARATANEKQAMVKKAHAALLVKKAHEEKCAAAAKEINSYLEKVGLSLSDLAIYLGKSPRLQQAANIGGAGVAGAGLGGLGAALSGDDISTGALGGLALGAGGYAGAKALAPRIAKLERIQQALKATTGEGAAAAGLTDRALAGVGRGASALEGFNPASALAQKHRGAMPAGARTQGKAIKEHATRETARAQGKEEAAAKYYKGKPQSD